MDAKGANWLATNPLILAFHLIESKAKQGRHKVKLPKQNPSVTEFLTQSLEKNGYNVRIGTIWLINKGHLIVMW